MDLFEVSCLTIWVVCLSHSLWTGKLRLGLVILAGSALAGWLMEWYNISAFQVYFYPLQLYAFVLLGGVPLSIVLGWGVVIYLCHQVYRKLGLPAAILTAVGMDVLLEPLAFYAGLWIWVKPDPLCPIHYFNAPLGNLVGWILFVSVGLLVSKRLSRLT